MEPDFSLYVVTDEEQCAQRGIIATIQAALEGGATLVQLRNKTANTRQLIRQARELLSICRVASVPLIINDRVDVALASGADGVHLGQSDMLAGDARKLLGSDAIIGVSVRDEAEALQAEKSGATYLGASGVWPTTTKIDAGSPLGLQLLEKIVKITPLPVVAIGGIGVKQASLIGRMGCAGIAVVSAVMKSNDPKRACETLKNAFKYG